MLLKKILITNTIKDLVSDFLYYDRKEDEELGVGEIEKAIKDKIITKEEIASCFHFFLMERLK